MIKVILNQIGYGPYIVAPEHCPYKQDSFNEDGDYLSINSSICPLCKLCEFVPSEIPIIKEITQSERDAIALYLTQQNKKVAGAMLAQFQYLVKEEKSPIAMLIQWGLLQEALKLVSADIERIKSLEQYFMLNDAVVCYCMGCPVYVSKKLTKTLLQVVGEISWRV
jgi:hypothetical protein